jgi:hypothetical protein
MNCKRVYKNLPLLAAQDLSEGRALRLQKHLDGCAGCRKELDTYRAALQSIRNLAKKEGLKSWGEAEWKDVIRRATSEAVAPKKTAQRVLPGPAWAYGLAIAILSVAAGFLLKFYMAKPINLVSPSEKTMVKQIETVKISPQKEPAPVDTAKAGVQESRQIRIGQKIAKPEAAKTQDTISVTLVSQETGLKVTWIFDKNFKWEGEEK